MMQPVSAWDIRCSTPSAHVTHLGQPGIACRQKFSATHALDPGSGQPMPDKARTSHAVDEGDSDCDAMNGREGHQGKNEQRPDLRCHGVCAGQTPRWQRLPRVIRHAVQLFIHQRRLRCIQLRLRVLQSAANRLLQPAVASNANVARHMIDINLSSECAISQNPFSRAT